MNNCGDNEYLPDSVELAHALDCAYKAIAIRDGAFNISLSLRRIDLAKKLLMAIDNELTIKTERSEDGRDRS